MSAEKAGAQKKPSPGVWTRTEGQVTGPSRHQSRRINHKKCSTCERDNFFGGPGVTCPNPAPHGSPPRIISGCHFVQMEETPNPWGEGGGWAECKREGPAAKGIRPETGQEAGQHHRGPERMAQRPAPVIALCCGSRPAPRGRRGCGPPAPGAPPAVAPNPGTLGMKQRDEAKGRGVVAIGLPVGTDGSRTPPMGRNSQYNPGGMDRFSQPRSGQITGQLPSFWAPLALKFD